jgi:hypothetical protein
MMMNSYVVIGYLVIVRLAYLIFPHLVGYKYFRYRQRKEIGRAG